LGGLTENKAQLNETPRAALLVHLSLHQGLHKFNYLQMMVKASMSISQLTDAQLVELAQQSRESAYFGELYRRYFHKVCDYCKNLTHDREQAYDLAQNSFIRAFEKIHTLRVAQTWVAWIFRIARNETLCFLENKRKRRIEDIAQHEHIADEATDVTTLVQQDAQEQARIKAITRLPTATHDLLMRKYRDGESIEDLQSRFNIGESAVKMRLLRARQQAISLAAAS
jgi:RNA polymerase sigma-70 factor (ECF subfamily)